MSIYEKGERSDLVFHDFLIGVMHFLRDIAFCVVTLLLAAVLYDWPAMAGTLEEVKKRSLLLCGIDGGIPGFSELGDDGAMKGMDADICRALAAGVLSSAEKLRFVPLTAKERFTALRSGEIDILSRNTTYSFTRDTSLGINFAYHVFLDGQAFMLRRELAIHDIAELSGARICVQAGTTTEVNLADYFRSNGLTFTPIGYETSIQTREGFEKGSCDAITADKSKLVSLRSELYSPDSTVILPQIISKEPLSPAVRQGDDEWLDIVNWVIFTLINAEEKGITSVNVEKMLGSDDPEIKRILGVEGNFGKYLNLEGDWAYQIIKQVGNYGEIYERNISPLGIERSGTPNALWTNGGIMYAPPFR